MATELELAYSHCQRVTKENARNFYYTSRPMPAAKRRAMYAVYAYCRLCDDIADGELPIDEKYRGFEGVRRIFKRASRPARMRRCFWHSNMRRRITRYRTRTSRRFFKA